MQPSKDKTCLVCRKDSNQTPLIPLEYATARIWICPQHMPILIHDPGRLVGMLPGAEKLEPAEHED